MNSSVMNTFDHLWLGHVGRFRVNIDINILVPVHHQQQLICKWIDVIDVFINLCRIYEGTMRRGDFIINSTTGRKVKVPRLVRMHSDDMEVSWRLCWRTEDDAYFQNPRVSMFCSRHALISDVSLSLFLASLREFFLRIFKKPTLGRLLLFLVLSVLLVILLRMDLLNTPWRQWMFRSQWCHLQLPLLRKMLVLRSVHPFIDWYCFASW